MLGPVLMANGIASTLQLFGSHTLIKDSLIVSTS